MEKLPRILYAEDNLNDIELTMAAFAECNLANKLDIVRDGEEVLDYLFYRNKYANRDKEIPGLLLLDIKMPKLDGIEALKIIRQHKDYVNLPVVMLTSSKMETDVIESYKTGANGFVVKPLDLYEFIKAVKGIGYFWAILNISPTKL